MMKITVDHESCSGQARCWAAAKELYALDDEGYSAIHELVVPQGQEQQARDGAMACPERAISVTEG
jgi:ferredoxin